MSEQLERGAEILKLARLLDVEPKELGYLEAVPSDALRTFREQATDRLFAGDAARLHRVAAASKLLPIPLTVKIAQIAFGPLLCAATAGLLEPRHAVRVATKCPTAFLADITINLDPRRAAEVIAAVPTPLVVAVAKELLVREEHVTVGRFVNYLRAETLRAAVPAIRDDGDLLKVAFVMEGKDALDDLAEIARDRFPGLIRAAAEQELWAEALDLAGNLSVRHLAELGDAAAALDDALLDRLVRAAQELSAWDVVLPVAAAMSADSLQRFARMPAIGEDEVLAGIVAAALSGDRWGELLPLAGYLPDGPRARLATLVAGLDDATLDRLATQANEAQLWDELIELAAGLPPQVRAVVANRAADLGRDDVVAALRRDTDG